MTTSKTHREHIAWLEAQCNRYVNGQCSTRKCLKRGGYSGKGPVDYSVATCIAHEIAQRLRENGPWKT